MTKGPPQDGPFAKRTPRSVWSMLSTTECGYSFKYMYIPTQTAAARPSAGTALGWMYPM